MQHWFETSHLVELNELSVVVRISFSVIFGGVLGFERTRKGRPAGLRTYMLVCLASCLVMISGIYLYNIMGPGFDPARMSAQVLSGIGFLGAGTILVTRHRRVKGLTTAAGLFTSACAGLTVGIGFYFGALVTLLACILIMGLADNLESKYISGRKRMYVYLILADLECLKSFTKHLQSTDAKMYDLELSEVGDGGTGIGALCTIKFPTKRDHGAALKEFMEHPGVMFMEEIEV